MKGSNIFCPKCNKEMIQLIDKKCTVLYEKCSACGGIWLDKGELEAMKHNEKKTIKRLWKIAKKEKNFNPVGIFYPDLCPKCGTGRLVETKKAGKIIVDECEHCQGMFLDNGEFEELLDTRSKWRKFVDFLNNLIFSF